MSGTGRYRVVIVGAGSAGITVAARLLRAEKSLRGSLAVLDPADKHYYQPLWTLVGGGVAKKETSEREMRTLIPRGAAPFLPIPTPPSNAAALRRRSCISPTTAFADPGCGTRRRSSLLPPTPPFFR